jgi:hypothetical protein
MKIALYIEDGLEQIVLTPETETERGIVGKMHDGDRQMTIHSGRFYGTVGGWVRHADEYMTDFNGGRREDVSTIIVLRPAAAGGGEAGR